MAVTITTHDVNGGNTGWTNQQVFDALEAALATAGHHSGTAVSNAVRKVVRPTDGWDQVGGICPIGTQSTPDRTWNSVMNASGTHYDEWDYTDPSPPGGGSAMKLTVARYGSSYSSSIQGKVAYIKVADQGSGYSNNIPFTIPAASCGGTGASPITFGTQSATVPAIKVWTTRGGTSNWWWSDTDVQLSANSNYGSKHKHGICRVVNDASKTLGITYYQFTIAHPASSTKPGLIHMKSGPHWDQYKTCPSDYAISPGCYQGAFGGDPGMDAWGSPFIHNGGTSGAGHSFGNTYSWSNEFRMQWAAFVNHETSGDGLTNVGTNDGAGYALERIYCRSQSATDYPLRIVVYKGASSQDPNFSIIQFQQVVAGEIEPYFTFSLNKGTQWGQNIWDLDHVFQGGIVEYAEAKRPTPEYHNHFNQDYNQDAILIAVGDVATVYQGQHSSPNIDNAPNHIGGAEVNDVTRCRESLYGYDAIRDGSNTNYAKQKEHVDSYCMNMDGYNKDEGYHYYAPQSISMYYRNNAYAKVTINSVSYQVDASMNFNKPMKGLPVHSKMMPCPYYFPDDFVMIQVAVTPGATVVAPGDTITVSGSEVYTVILADGDTNYAMAEDANNVVSRFICWCARTT